VTTVEEALFALDCGDLNVYVEGKSPQRVYPIIAAELKRLEAELDKPLMRELKELRAKLKRVEALPAKWRREGNGPYEVEDITLGVVADELEAALTRAASDADASEP
jgi:hypothetical protein